MNAERFERDVTNGFLDETGAFVEGVPDALKITSSKEYWDWYATKGYQPGDQKQAVKVLNEWKAEKASSAAKQRDAAGKEKVEKLKLVASGTIEPGTRSGGGSPSKEKAQDFDSAFEEAASQ